MTSPHRPTDRPRRSRRGRWWALGAAATVAASLGIVLVTQGGGAGAASAAPGRPSDRATARTTEPTTGTSSAGAATPTSVTTGADRDDDVVAEVVQPQPLTPPSEGEKAPPIGPFGDLATRVEGDPLAIGRVDAPVVMVTFEDYRCPFCALYSQTVQQPLIDKYVDAGVLRIEWRDFPVFGDESARAAVAGRAAAAQGKFWEFNDAVYAAAPEHGNPSLPDAALIGFAKKAGVADIDRFVADLDNDEYIAAVAADFDEGGELGVPATPSFVINGYPLRGAQPIGEFEQLIETAAALAPSK